ncbi:MAG: excinuclease ABC subunit UvrA [Patescibacteria group bacterium]
MTNSIKIKGARQHNLKDLNLEIPKNKLVVFTGISGSGKSSLAFDTLYAEGQRRYVESLSSYARQFLGVMNKPDVDHIEGLSPAISIDQKTTSHNPRSTVGTITEIYDYLRLLFARVGHPHCPDCGREVSTQSVDQIVNHVLEDLDKRANSQVTRFMILSPIVRDRKGEFQQLFENLQKKGYQRLRIDNKFYDVDSNISLIKTNKHTISVVLDRLVTSKKQLRNASERKTLRSRLVQSIEESLKLSDGFVTVSYIQDDSLNFPDNPTNYEDRLFSEKLACSYCGISISELEPRLFSFNSPHGACPSCNGLGSILKIDKEKIIAPALTLSEGAIVPFARVMGNDSWWSRLVREVIDDSGFDFRKTAFFDMNSETQNILLYGSDKVYEVRGTNRYGKETVIHQKFEGFIKNLERRYAETDSEYMRKEIGQYMMRQKCESCDGTRLKDEALAVHINNTNIAKITSLTINRSLKWVEEIVNKNILSEKEKIISKPILKEITSRLSFLNAVGLNYLSLNREASTLAGGEAQRIRLASQIGTGLTGVLYILDEPTIGLHQRDNDRLISTLKQLRDKGNTVIVVEHDRDLMLSSDHIVDFGPLAGEKGGELVAEGSPEKIMASRRSLTGKYLKRKLDVETRHGVSNGKRQIIDPDAMPERNASGSKIRIEGATQHNLKSIDVDFPLKTLTCITGISGSGKSTLLHDTLYHHLAKSLGKKISKSPGKITKLMVPDEVKKVNLIDQSPIGKTPRSNPATYTKIFDYIRKVFANTRDAQMRGFKIGRFSFNVKGGRCETCQGDGQLKIEMQFLPDVYVTCDVCEGKRYNAETLEVRYKTKTISDVLQMSVDEALKFFANHSTLRKKLQTLQDVGLGYIRLGQPAPTLSGGEAQRVKLAKELSTRYHEHAVYLLDEPTTGLHFHDVQKLLDVLHQLVAQNNTVIVIEHNLDVIKNADWLIDLGPEGGEYGGELLAEAKPTQVIKNPNSFTGQYLKEEFQKMQSKKN